MKLHFVYIFLNTLHNRYGTFELQEVAYENKKILYDYQYILSGGSRNVRMR